jgi:LssY C-terminus
MPVHAFLLESPQCENAPVFSTKIPIEGRVLSVHRVGLGIMHERAALEIEFFRIFPTGQQPVEIQARVKLIDNARESVKNGVIRGIRSTETPQGRITSRLKYLPSLHLYPDPFLLGYKMLFPIFPEPEIILEPGTDVQVELAQAVSLPNDLPPVVAVPILDQDVELNKDLESLPERTFTKKGKEADVINMVFEGPKSDLEQAFHTAGWQESEAVSTHTVVRQFYSVLANTSYPTAPMSAQLLEGREASLTLEKSYQSPEKRNHVRIWAVGETPEGVPLWASAAVRETGATLSIRQKGFIHHVSEDVSEEQQTVVRDLLAAGCVDAVGSLPRPTMDHLMRNATGEYFRTDGSLSVVRLKPCTSDSHGAGFSDVPPSKPGSRASRYLRREILTVRSDIWRANCIYGLFDLTRMTVTALRRSPSQREAAELQTKSASRPIPQMQTFAPEGGSGTFESPEQ